MHSLTWDAKQSDKKMLQDFIKVANEADEMIGHNGDKFDMTWIRTRCLFHRIPMLPAYTTIDTLKISRSKFRFNSNRLNYIADFLGMGQKHKVEFGLWKDILLRSDPAAMAKMVRYCKKDVVLLEKVFTELSKHTESKTHFGVVNGQNRGSCPNCGSHKLFKKCIRVLASGLKRMVMQCDDCKRFCTKTLNKKGEVMT